MNEGRYCVLCDKDLDYPRAKLKLFIGKRGPWCKQCVKAIPELLELFRKCFPTIFGASG